MGHSSGGNIFIYKIFKSRLASLVISAIMAVQLVACGGGSSGSSGSSGGSGGGSNSVSTAAASEEVEISGSVGDGPLVGATITVSSSGGQEIGTIVSGKNAAYIKFFFVRKKNYPLLLSVNDGFDLVTGSAPDFRMLSVKLNRRNGQANINPFSTLIVKIAQLMPGGVNESNINTAKGYVTEQLGFGLDLNVINDPITTRITDANAANIIKASEALGEMVRRTRDTLSAAGTVVSGDDVIAAIAADMIDGYLDGAGAKAVNPSISRVARVVSAQVLVEALSNNLKVGGIVATGVIDQAIATTRPGASSSEMTGDVRITAGMLKQTIDSLETAAAMDSSGAVTGILATVGSIAPNARPTAVARKLPAGSSAVLDAAVELSATSTAGPGAINQGTDSARQSTSDADGSTSTRSATTIKVPASGGSPASAGRIATRPVVYYPFTEGAGSVVSDQSGNGAPMNLGLSGSVSWSAGGNGVVLSGGRVGTAGAATKVINALRASNMSSFEIWVEPANVTQTGPTRMISVGGGTSVQNFMLGQRRDEVEARLMHTGKDAEGKPRLSTANGPLRTALVHLVHTYDGAVERLYINGVPYSETLAIGGGYSNWDVNDLFSIGNEASSNRPYAGVVRLVAVYDRALGDAEVQQNFAAGAGSPVAGGGGTAGTGDGGTGSGDTGSGDTGGTGSGSTGGTDTGGSGGADSGTTKTALANTTPANTAPVISGSPAGSIQANASYAFQPNASDADGNVLAFSIANKPGWADFSNTTGRLSGPVTNADAGSYKNILISVTDGLDRVSLPAFSIRVDAVAVPTGSFTLNWTAPVARSDGTPMSLAEIDGYRIYYGKSSGDYPHSVNVTDGSADSATVRDVPAGDYRVVMTTYDDAGRESANSAEITKSAH